MAAISPERLRATATGAASRALIQRQKETERSRKEQARSRAREEQIQQSLCVNPNRAGKLIIKGLLSEMKESAAAGRSELVWSPIISREPVGDGLQQIVITVLKERGFRVRVRCGHGHKSWTTKGRRLVYVDSFLCDGTTYSSCWPEVIISW